MRAVPARVPGSGCPDAVKPGIHGARTHWIRGFMTFHRSGAGARTGGSERGRGAGGSAGEVGGVYAMMWEKGGVWGLGVI